MKKSVEIIHPIGMYSAKLFHPVDTDPALFPTNYWIVRRKDSTYAFANAYKRGRFYYEGILIKDVTDFACLSLP